MTGAAFLLCGTALLLASLAPRFTPARQRSAAVLGVVLILLGLSL